ncbi:MAG: hypothetical protein J7507_11945 [Pseudoxanthomonas sp.]|nr:hypothetical protein [Pseudoxanthomonas sp.]
MNAFDQAAAELESAKIAEARAAAARIDAEQKMLRLMPAKDEGSVTERGLHFKVTATYGVNRTLDGAALEAVRAAMSPELFGRVIDYAPKLRLEGVRYLQANEPEVYAVLAQAITAKPAKPSVKVEAVEAMGRAA